MVINKVTLPDLDLAELEVAERYEQEMQKYTDAVSTLSGNNRVEIIRTVCTATFALFDGVFGDGTSKKVFGNRTNLVICNKAMSELIDASNKIDKQNSNETKKIFAKYNPNRAVRIVENESAN